MAAEVAEQLDEQYEQSWSIETPAVRKAVSFIRSRGGTVTADELVAWDAKHGRRLFNWNTEAAAADWRLYQARLFLNSFRSVIDGMRLRAYINVPAGEETGREEKAYVALSVISADQRQRAWAIKSIVRRMKVLASELRFFKLEAAERDAVIAELNEAMEFQ